MTQNAHDTHCPPLIGDKAPAFEASGTKGMIHFPEDYSGQWVVLFSHPADLSEVCLLECTLISDMADDFKKMNTQFVGVSIDSANARIAGLRSIQEIRDQTLLLHELRFPIVEDIPRETAIRYGMIDPLSGLRSAVRSVFIIDPKHIIRAISYYPPLVPRSIDEIKRVLTALQQGDQVPG
ncbi:MAG: redoxin domain-containing protein [Eubacteriales bacterium]|jgi:peroxiredoxin (alkyl hydroperoxide reductase subunit C)|nr:redoxin domain-containing protein [Eubacteriales bacterium]MDD4104926.1 redoxin domain-containing protein [Eubacteriales bacterium]MDD4710080.1 redoxin domain-containing protein [Eubacteriales bacterium]NLO16002.1 redoxin domain-containing protein [Clostridiales bacterium]